MVVGEPSSALDEYQMVKEDSKEESKVEKNKGRKEEGIGTIRMNRGKSNVQNEVSRLGRMRISWWDMVGVIKSFYAVQSAQDHKLPMFENHHLSRHTRDSALPEESPAPRCV